MTVGGIMEGLGRGRKSCKRVVRGHRGMYNT